MIIIFSLFRTKFNEKCLPNCDKLIDLQSFSFVDRSFILMSKNKSKTPFIEFVLSKINHLYTRREETNIEILNLKKWKKSLNIERKKVFFWILDKKNSNVYVYVSSNSKILIKNWIWSSKPLYKYKIKLK